MSAPLDETKSDAPATQSFGQLARRLGPTTFLAIGACVLPPLGAALLLWKMNPIGAWLRAHGTEGAALFALAFGVAAGLALLPTYAASILSGWAFGFALGYPTALVGFTLGALIGYGVSRAAAERVEAVLRERPKWVRVRDELLKSNFLRACAIITLVRLPPNSPFAIGNLIMGSIRVPVGAFVIGTVAGMAPRTAVAVWAATLVQKKLGANAEAADIVKEGDQLFGWWYIGIGIGAAIVVVLILTYLAQRTLARMTDIPRANETA